MKKLFTIAVASIAVAAAADTYSPSIGVTSIGLSQKNNVIPVQFNSLATSGNVTAGELVCTNNIPPSSHLYVYVNGWTAWELQASGWAPVTTVTADGITGGSGADTKLLPAGSAIWLSFHDTPDSAINVSFYGKVAATTNTTIAAGTKEPTKSAVSTLVCNPTGKEISGELLANKLAALNPAVGDKIKFDEQDFTGYYSFNGTTWGKIDGNYPIVTGLPALPANKGFWYVSLGGSGTISW